MVMLVLGSAANTNEAMLAFLTLASYCEVPFLTGHRPVLDCGLGVGDSCSRKLCTHTHTLASFPNPPTSLVYLCSIHSKLLPLPRSYQRYQRRVFTLDKSKANLILEQRQVQDQA